MSGPVRGWVQTVNERIDRSVFERCQLHPDYRPPGLLEWPRRKGLDLEAVIANLDQHPELFAPVTRPGIERRPIPPASALHPTPK
jgi:hypothetical protein